MSKSKNVSFVRIMMKVMDYLFRSLILTFGYINSATYMKIYKRYLQKKGMIFIGNGPGWIANDVKFDGTDYGLITLGEGCLISRDVLFLTHDYSFHTVVINSEKIDCSLASEITKINKDDFLEKKEIYVGNNSFVGMRASILPGTHIGNNCIIGGGAVVKGHIEDNSIVVGNPAKIINKTTDWILEKIQNQSNKNVE